MRLRAAGSKRELRAGGCGALGTDQKPLASDLQGLFRRRLSARLEFMDYDLTQLHRDACGLAALRVNLHGDLGDLADTLLKVRALQAFDCGARRLPIHRKTRFAARRGLEEIFDDLALRSGLVAHRLDTAALGTGVFVSATGRRKTDYSSGTLEIWAEDVARAESTRASLLELVGPQRVRAEIFTIDWHFSSAHGGLTNVAVDELADTELLDEAYPMLPPLRTLIDGYLGSRETVLVVQGPPGTGKTRLVRAILGAMSKRKGDSAKILYTADRRALGAIHHAQQRWPLHCSRTAARSVSRASFVR